METLILCQSCGMAVEDAELGTEKDGSSSSSYCDECYMDGEFIIPELTIDEMTDIVIDEMERKGSSGEKIDFAVRNLENLKRWKAN